MDGIRKINEKISKMKKKSEDKKYLENYLKLIYNILYSFFLTDFLMHKEGIIYRAEQYKNKVKYKLKKEVKHVIVFLKSKEKSKIIKILTEIEKTLEENDLSRLKKHKGKTAESATFIVANIIRQSHCSALRFSLQKAVKEKKELDVKEIETEFFEDLISWWFADFRKELKNTHSYKICKEKAITIRMKKKKVRLVTMQENLSNFNKILSKFFSRQENMSLTYYPYYQKVLVEFRANLEQLYLVLSKQDSTKTKKEVEDELEKVHRSENYNYFNRKLASIKENHYEEILKYVKVKQNKKVEIIGKLFFINFKKEMKEYLEQKTLIMGQMYLGGEE
jgi:hypothetical protein